VSADPRVGTEVAGHRIESVIGRGGSSVVYLAEHVRLGRKVALKLLAPELSEDAAFRRRFIRESRAAAELDHPNIVRVYDAGEADGTLYISMQYIEGTDLAQLLRRDGRLHPARVASIASQCADALDAAHARGLVHRDVKPANILVAGTAGGKDRVFLSDFGITKRQASSGGITRTGEFVGTIDYIAPEQILGQPVDARTDVYSLGCVLFECLTGKPPFEREHDVAVVYAHLGDAPPRISERAPDLPAGLDGVLARAMAKSKEARFPSCGGFAEAMRSVLSPMVPTLGRSQGARFARRQCPMCGQENPEQAKFCLSCATALDAAGPPIGDERRVVTVLFCDLVGSTSAAEFADPEDVRARLSGYHELVASEVERFGGTVEKFIGDAIVAIFGVPVAHEDDAERAVRAGLAVLEAIDRANEEGSHLDLQVRIGVNTGEALVALGARPERGEGIVTGDIVNVAARLQAAAPPGGLLVGEATERSTRSSIEYERVGPTELKGRSEAVQCWRALRVRSRLGVDLERPTTPFVGRETELEVLKEAFETAARERSLQLVTVVGEPGAGKTRLVAEFRHRVNALPELVWWRQGRCLPYGDGIAFWALAEVVKAHAGILDSDAPAIAMQKLSEVVAPLADDSDDRRWLDTRLAALIGVGQGSGPERAESFAAWRTFLERLAAQRPLVIVIEDLHWADDALLAFLADVVDRFEGAPFLVIFTARPEVLGRDLAWRGKLDHSRMISLEPLADDDMARLIDQLLEGSELPDGDRAALLERADGNPLYAEEYVRLLRDREFAEASGSGARGAAELPIPDSLHMLIAARLDALAPETKALMQNGAVVGKVFWSGAVASMSGTDENAARVGLRELTRRQLIRPARLSTVEHQDEYAFWHALVRDVAYGQIPRASRAAKHEAVAAWIEAVSGARVSEFAELLAHHCDEAAELAAAAGSEGAVPELEHRRIRFHVLAGDRLHNLDPARAWSHYCAALEHLPEEDPIRPEVALKSVDAGFVSRTNAPGEFEAVHRWAIARCRELGDPVKEADAMRTLSFGMWNVGRVEEAFELIYGAVFLLESLPPGRELVKAYGELAGRLCIAGRDREALPWIDKGLHLADEMGLQEEERSKLLQVRGMARSSLGDPGGLDDLRAGLAVAKACGSIRETTQAYVNLSFHVWIREGPAASLRLHREDIEIAERRWPGHAWWATGETCWMLYDLGEWDEVLSVASRVEGWAEVVGNLLGGPNVYHPSVMADTYRLLVSTRRGSPDAGLESSVLERARSIRDPQLLVPALGVGAVSRLASNRGAEALALVGELEKVTEESPRWRAHFLTDAVRVSVAMGEIGTAERLVGGLEPTAARDRYSVLAANAALAEARGEATTAVDLYAEAAEEWTKYGHVPEEGAARLGLARVLREMDRSQEASEQAGHAVAIFARLGAAEDEHAARTLVHGTSEPL
jgi:class 3 adenylate cyclase/tRNA A-37 threonylcarbamoyl transferase component Bud32